MNTPSLQSSAMLLDLTISVYTGRKSDRQSAAELTASKGATSTDAATVQKYLFAGDKDLRDIISTAARCRERINRMTLPWDDRGVRLVPTAAFFNVTQTLADLEQEFNAKVDKFVDNYASKVSNAAFTLGAMFNRDEYPTPDQVRHRYSFKHTFMPVPDSGDFRVDIPNEALAQLTARYEAHSNDRVEQAISDVVTRLHDVILTMRDLCTTPESGPRPRLYESTLEQTKELCDIVKQLNLFNDPGIEEVRQGLHSALRDVDIESLRGSQDMRESVRNKMNDLLDKFV